jgi:hypothetical protein
MRSLRIAAVALLGTALSAASAQQPTSHPTSTKDARSQRQQAVAPLVKALHETQSPSTQALPKTHPTSERGAHHSLVSGGSDLCGSATPISGAGPFNGDNIGSNSDGPSNCGALSNDVWYDWTAGATGSTLFSLCGSGYDTVISVYDGAGCTGPLLACDDDSSCGLQSQVTVSVVNGQVYKVQVGGFAGSQGNYTLSIAPPAPPPSCPCAGFPPEGEANCGLPTDTVNGGCNYGPPFLYGSLACGGGVCGTGAFNGSTRDLDWYSFTITSQSIVTVNVNAEFLSDVFIADNLCPASLFAFNTGPACVPLSVSANLAPGTYTAIIAPDFASPVITCGQGTGENYTASLTCQSVGGCGCVDQEGETNCGIPTDNLNGGCNYGPPFLYGSLTCGQTFCGTGGWDGTTRDLDWYAFTLSAPDTVTLTVTAEFLSDAFIADNLCPTSVFAFNSGPACTPYTVSASLPAGTYTAIVAADFGGPIITCGVNNSYTAVLSCNGPPPPPLSCEDLSDGVSEDAIGFGIASPGSEILWMTKQGGTGVSTVINSIQTAWGTPTGPGSGPPNGTIGRVGIWQDNDGGDPTSGLVLLATASASVVNTETDFAPGQTFDLIPPVYVQGQYWIGAASEGTFPAPLDTSTPGNGRCFIVGDFNAGSGSIDFNNLNAAPVPPLDEDQVLPGVWLIRGDCKDKGTMTSFCAGDTLAACPCGNNNLPPNSGGCGNSDHPQGALITPTGTASIAAADLGFVSTGHHKSSLCIWFQGDILVGQVPYGDGSRCVGNPLVRLYTMKFAPPGNPGEMPDPLFTPSSPTIVAAGGITTPGTVKGYFLAYRDPANFACSIPATFNASNAYKVVWAP